MPYEIEFQKEVEYSENDYYFNDCCFGGEKIAELFLPYVNDKFTDVQFEQEDWGWFIWFKNGKNDAFSCSIFGSCRNQLRRKKG